MSSLSLNSSAYRRKMMIGEHKKVKPMDNQSEGRSKDSEVGQEEKDKKIVDDKEKEKEKIKQELSVSIQKSYPIIKSIKKVFYIKLNYPEKKELNIDYKTGDIITNILDIPENYLGIICFDPKTFPKDNDRANLYDVAYWLANDNCVTYISMGKTVSLLKNDSI